MTDKEREREAIHQAMQNEILEAGHSLTFQQGIYNIPNDYTMPPIYVHPQPEPQQRYTYILDIDGCIFKHQGKDPTSQFDETRPLLDGVTKFFEDCGKKGHRIILLSGRRESMRAITERQLHNAGISYDALILGATNAIRVLVNDTKPYANENNTAIAYSIPRDSGLSTIPR